MDVRLCFDVTDYISKFSKEVKGWYNAFAGVFKTVLILTVVCALMSVFYPDNMWLNIILVFLILVLVFTIPVVISFKPMVTDICEGYNTTAIRKMMDDEYAYLFNKYFKVALAFSAGYLLNFRYDDYYRELRVTIALPDEAPCTIMFEAPEFTVTQIAKDGSPFIDLYENDLRLCCNEPEINIDAQLNPVEA